jgi:hypothetical protein
MATSTNSPFVAATPDKHAVSAPNHHEPVVTPQSLPPLVDAAVPRPAPETEKHPKGKRKRTAYVDETRQATAVSAAALLDVGLS